jgi:predicted aspartyl protease
MLPTLISLLLAQASPAAAQPPPAVPYQARSSAATLPAAPEHETLPARSDDRDRMTVEVGIGEKGPFHFLVDTGAQTTVISSGLAHRLGLVPTARHSVLGIAGRIEVDTVELPEIRLGRRTYADYVTPMLEDANLGADGIIGIDGLQGHRVLLDFQHQKITLADARSLTFEEGFEIVVSARRRAGQLIMTNADIDGVTTEVVLDTGAEGSIGNRALQRALARRHDTYAATLLSVTGQTINADMGMARQLTVDRLFINNVVIAYADSPTFAALKLDRRPAVLLGMRELRLFKRVVIDFQGHRVLFDVSAFANPAAQMARLR